jgi:tetratricopeptide (TPR) repeat protein
MRRAFVLAVLAAIIVLIAIPLSANEAAAKLIKRGDKFFGNRGKGVKWCVKAIECYEKALAVDTENVEASWKFARGSYFLGDHTEGDDKKLVIFKKGIDVAKRAVSIDDKSVEAHFYLGVSYGVYGRAKGVMNSLGLIDPIKKEMAKVIELDETFLYGGAHRVLGKMFQKVPGVAGGSTEKAIEHLEKAVALGPENLLNHLFLAQSYMAADETAKAKKELQWVIDAPVVKGWEPENKEEKEKAKKLLAELEE